MIVDYESQQFMNILKTTSYANYKLIFEYIVQQNIPYTQNNNGIFFNLNNLSEEQLNYINNILIN